jgi:hypothetical protein
MRARSSWIAVIVSAAAAGCTPTVDHKQVEEQLQRELGQMNLQVTAVTCSSDIEAKERQRVPCKVEIERRKTYAVAAVVWGNSLVNVDWLDGLDGTTMVATDWEARMANDLGKDLGGKVAVKCGDDPLLFEDAEHKLHCQLIAGDATSKATLELDHTGKLSWQLEPPVVARAKLEEIALRGVRDEFPDVKIACGQGEFVRRPDDGRVDCTVTAGHKTGTIKLEFDALTAADAALSNPADDDR